MQQMYLPSLISGALKTLWWQYGQSAVEGRGRSEQTKHGLSLSLSLSLSLCFVAMACNGQFVIKTNVPIESTLRSDDQHDQNPSMDGLAMKSVIVDGDRRTVSLVTIDAWGLG